MKAIILLSFLSFLLISCEETREACLDYYASNYDFGAVSGCDSCCQYPKVNLNFNLEIDYQNFSFNNTYHLSGNDSITIKNCQILFSNFLFFSSDSNYRILDEVGNNDVSIIDDFYLFRSDRLSINNIGHSNFETDLNLLEFDLGVDKVKLEALKPFNLLEDDSHLNVVVDSMYNSTTSEFSIFKIDFEIYEQIQSFDIINLNQSHFKFDISKVVIPGKDWDITLKLNFTTLFSGVNSSMSGEEMESMIINNISKAITLK